MQSLVFMWVSLSLILTALTIVLSPQNRYSARNLFFVLLISPLLLSIVLFLYVSHNLNKRNYRD